MAQVIDSSQTGKAFYRFRVGGFELISINDGLFNFPPPAFGTNMPEGSVEQELESHLLPTTHVGVQLHCLLVNTGSNLVLIDTGLGPNIFPGDSATSGRLISTLEHLGVQGQDIDTVIFTHGHPDHVGGAASNGTPNFPNARHIISKTDWDFWGVHPGNVEDPFLDFMLSVGAANLKPLEGKIELISEETEVVPGIRMIDAPGHTLGHMAVLISSDGEQLLNMADVVVQYIVAPKYPNWHLAADMDPELAVETRLKILARASDEQIKIFGDHFPFPGIGYMLKDESNGSWRFLPTG